jgi:ketosteroid isomerase-like protein
MQASNGQLTVLGESICPSTLLEGVTMNRRVLRLLATASLVVIIGWLMAAEGANVTEDSSMSDKNREEFVALERESAQAFVRNDADAIGRQMAEDWTIVTPEGNVLDRSTFLGLIKSGDLSHEAMEFADTSVRVYGDTAVVTARATSKGSFKGHRFTESERSTDVFVKQAGQWKCVLTHLTRIAKK